MNFFRNVGEYDVAGLRDELEAQPELWDAFTMRTRRDFPFGGTHDIWLRHRNPIEVMADPSSVNQPHFAEFWPAWKLLPSAHPIVFDLMSRANATGLGAVLITRIPPGEQVRPHSDKGFWNAEFYPLKVYVVIEGNDECVNHCGDEQMVMRTGEAIVFDNRVTHSVVNRGKTNRTTLIVCLRTA